MDGDCSHEIRRWLLLGRKALTNLDSMLKSKDIVLPTNGPYSRGHGLSNSHVLLWEMNSKEGRMLKNWCFQIVVLEKTLESALESKEIKIVNLKGNQPWILWKDWCWSWSSITLATWCEELTHWKRPWWWERLKAEEEGDRWGGWMASPIQWTWTWTISGKWWRTGKSGMLQSMESRVRHNFVTEQQQHQQKYCNKFNNDFRM